MGKAVRKQAMFTKCGIPRTLVLIAVFTFASPGQAIGAAPDSGKEFCNPRAPSGPSLDLGSILKPAVCPIKDAGVMKCDPAKYAKHVSQGKSCKEVCKVAVDKWIKELPEEAAAAAKADTGLAGEGLKAGAGSTKGVNAGLQAFRGQQQNASTRGKAQQQRGDSADKAKTKFDQCVSEVNTACKQNLHPEDHKVASAVVKACEDASSGAGKFAGDKKQDGAGMGDLSKLMDAASKAMGMANQGKGEPETPAEMAQSAATSPTPVASQAPETQVTKLSGNSTNAPSVGFGNIPGQVVAAAQGLGNTGSGLSGASFSSDAYDSSGASDPNSGAGGVGSPMAGSDGSAGGGGGGEGSSSSSMPRSPASEVVAALDSSGAFEMNGGGGKSFGGLKASKSDMDEVADGSVLGGGEEEAGGQLEEGEENAAGEEPMMDESDSIFERVRNKYGSLKGSGRI